MITFAEASILAQERRPRLLAIDGLPCSGKSTLAHEIIAVTGCQCLAVDDFFLRFGPFLAAMKDLAGNGCCSYFPHDWESLSIGIESRTVALADGPVLVEGTASLHPDIAPLFDPRFFVESDERSILEAILERDGDFFENEWRNHWLPNAATYMLTKPRGRADYIVAGRGCGSHGL